MYTHLCPALTEVAIIAKLREPSGWYSRWMALKDGPNTMNGAEWFQLLWLLTALEVRRQHNYLTMSRSRSTKEFRPKTNQNWGRGIDAHLEMTGNFVTLTIGSISSWSHSPFGKRKKEMIDDLDKQGVLKQSQSPSNSPIWPFLKSGTNRWCLDGDLRPVNKATKPTAPPVALMPEIVASIQAGAFFFSFLFFFSLDSWHFKLLNCYTVRCT